VDGWTLGPAGFVACGSFRASDSTMRRMNGHGSIVLVLVVTVVGVLLSLFWV
jgi:hypothetical protein